MSTAVKMGEEAKSRLEELQAEIKLRTGEKVTQQEILERLVDDAYESKSEFVESFNETTVPATEEEIEAFHRGTFDSGVETDEEDIDDILYG
jgi:predicted nuclease with TOPRIM domain